MGEYGDFCLGEEHYYNYSQVLKKFPLFHTAVLQYSKYPRYPKKSAILSVFAVFAIFPVSGKFPVSIILPLCHSPKDWCYFIFFVN